MTAAGTTDLAIAECGNPEVAEDFLPMIHLVFANLKTWLTGVHHGVSRQHLQAYPQRVHVPLSAPTPSGRFAGDRRRRQDAARQFRRLQRPQGGAHDVGRSASRSNRARPFDGRGEEQRDSGRARADRGPRPEGLCVHARRRTRPKKSFERVIASGNHLLTQVKDNQPACAADLNWALAGRKPSGSAKTETAGRNRWETRELTVFHAKAWFRDTPWEKLIKTVLRLERTVCERTPATGLCAQTTEVVFWISSASNQMPQRWNEWDPRPLADRERQPLRARHRLRRGRFPHPQEPRHRRSPAILRLQSDPRRWRLQHPKRSLARRPRSQRPRLRESRCLRIPRSRRDQIDIRLPRNNILQERIGYLLKRPAGRPSVDVRRSKPDKAAPCRGQG